LLAVTKTTGGVFQSYDIKKEKQHFVPSKEMEHHLGAFHSKINIRKVFLFFHVALRKCPTDEGRRAIGAY
jgi:hypothetical protein